MYDRSAREILLSICDMFILSILFKNRWWCLFHRRRRVKTVRSNQRKHLKSGLTRIKSQQSCLIATVVESQRLPTRSCHCQATRWRSFLFSSSLLLLLLPLPCLQKTLEKRWSHLVDSAHCSSFCQDFDNLILSRAGEFGDSGEDFEVETHSIISWCCTGWDVVPIDYCYILFSLLLLEDKCQGQSFQPKMHTQSRPWLGNLRQDFDNLTLSRTAEFEVFSLIIALKRLPQTIWRTNL